MGVKERGDCLVGLDGKIKGWDLFYAHTTWNGVQSCRPCRVYRVGCTPLAVSIIRARVETDYYVNLFLPQ